MAYISFTLLSLDKHNPQFVVLLILRYNLCCLLLLAVFQVTATGKFQRLYSVHMKIRLDFPLSDHMKERGSNGRREVERRGIYMEVGVRCDRL